MHIIIAFIIGLFTHHVVNIPINHYPIETKRFEGLRLCPYRDTVGKITIGYGHNVQGGNNSNLIKASIIRKDVISGKCINQEQADKLYSLDMAEVSAEVSKLIDNYNEQPTEVQLILNDMGFNLGTKGLAKFTEFLTDIENKHYKWAAEDLTGTKWHRQVKSRAKLIESELRKIPDGK